MNQLKDIEKFRSLYAGMGGGEAYRASFLAHFLHPLAITGNFLLEPSQLVFYLQMV